MSSQIPSPSNSRASRQQETIDSYPNVPEPKQAHGGNALAILSVFAILAFGVWTAIGTLTGSGELPSLSPQAVPSVVPTKPAAAAPAPTAAVTAAPTKAPAAAATPTTGGARVHVVGSGDTLTRIAQTYGTTVDAIMAANGFSDRSKILRVGDKLNIP